VSKAIDQQLQSAFSLHQAGQLDKAASVYRQIIKSDPDNSYALQYLGVIEAGLGHFDQAKSLMMRSVLVNPSNIQFIENCATVLVQVGDYDSALQMSQKGLALNKANVSLLYVSAIAEYKLRRLPESLEQFDKVLALAPNHIAAINERGSVLAEMKQYDSALASFEKALQLQPLYPEAWLNRGNVLHALKQHDHALAAYDKAAALKPNLAAAWLGRGNVARSLKRYDEALASYDKALALFPNLAGAWLGRGNAFYRLKRYDDAAASYDKALTLEPHLANAWLGRGNVFEAAKRYDHAIAAFDQALALDPDLASAWLGRGNVFHGQKRDDQAIASYEKALDLEPNLAEAWLGRGSVFVELRRYQEAVASLGKALALEPDLNGAEGARLHYKMHLCDWTDLSAERQHLVSSVKKGKANASPFSLIATSTSGDDQLRCAKVWVSKEYPASPKPIWNGEIYKHDRIRVAYISADFYLHAIAILIAGMLECHDRTRFETTGISIGPSDDSELRNRLKNGFECFLDGSLLSDDEIAHQIKQKQIDILVDLTGFTQHARTGIFARRPAPIQINYLGFPATMGADFIDYIVADRTVVPESHQQHFSEKVVYLPNSYQANDAKRAISEKSFSREEMGLKDDSFVFCCFNNSFKILPETFDCWGRILKQVDGSVLWLLESSATVAENLRKEARHRGLGPERLVFAPRVSPPDHLARHRCADLFLDTLPYNAHTTASDALWAGLPVLTQIGETFAGRVAASLLTAIGLPELITSTSKAYENLAIELAKSPEKLAALKRKLAENRLTTPLFNTQSFTREIESAYAAIYERYQKGLSPAHTYLTQQNRSSF
jgi:predicted O-linked N-acetylglucosamine transferase (SPINDLY family)